MKLLIVIALIGCLSAIEVDKIEIQEGKEIVHESIVLDKHNGRQTYHTDDHCGRKAVTEMIDSNYGIAVSKFDKDDKNCIVRPYDPLTDSNPNEVSRALEITNNKMPETVEEIKHMYLYEPYENAASLPEHIKNFCAGRVIVTRQVVVDLKQAAETALKQAKAAKKNAKKRAVLREFTACTNASTMKIMTCPGDKLRADCKIRRSSCTYWVKCPMNLQKGGFDCKGLHKFNSMICCDYNC